MIEDYLNKYLGTPKRSGKELNYECPFCHHNKKVFYINNNPKSTHYGQWICFSCGRSGNFVALISALSDVSYHEAEQKAFSMDYYAALTNNIQSDELSPNENLLLMLNRPAATETSESFMDTPVGVFKSPPLPTGLHYFSELREDARPFIVYCKNRGIDMVTLLENGAGYVQDGFAKTKTGMLHIRNHVIFFSYNKTGQYIYWNSRSIDGGTPKSINAPELDGCYSRKNVVFGLDVVSKWSKVVLVEGVPDALTLENGIATFGKMVTNYQKRLIIESLNPDQKLYVMLDMDAKKELFSLARSLYPYHNNTYVVFNPEYRDANSLGHDKAWGIINQYSFPATASGITRFSLLDKV